ncbi:rod-binding protein [Pseudotabrizicola formosa]|uniref:rod-binding protein n=1 Tax=Pseudotabrizicola formosa TaxID=2030009 RepID=UPI000CD17B58|nr:rod-binding protein [Pseudotabrizicola formosa]
MNPEPVLIGPARLAPDRNHLMHRAKELEAVFLSEMLSHAGLGESSGEFEGGMGERQFASFLRDAQARSIVEKGGLGLAQTIFEALIKAEEARDVAKS